MTPAGIDRLCVEEGFRAHVYTDTRGFLSVGYGCNLSAGISPAQGKALLSVVVDSNRVLLLGLDWFVSLDPIRQDVIEDMAYELGFHGLLGFYGTITDLAKGDYAAAANGMLQSLWAKQVPNRAGPLAEAMRNGPSTTA